MQVAEVRSGRPGQGKVGQDSVGLAYMALLQQAQCGEVRAAAHSKAAAVQRNLALQLALVPQALPAHQPVATNVRIQSPRF